MIAIHSIHAYMLWLNSAVPWDGYPAGRSQGSFRVPQMKLRLFEHQSAINYKQTVACLGWTSGWRDTMHSDTLKCHCQFAKVINSFKQSVMQRPRGCVQGLNLSFVQSSLQQGNQLWQGFPSKDFWVLWGQDNSGDTFPHWRNRMAQELKEGGKEDD